MAKRSLGILALAGALAACGGGGAGGSAASGVSTAPAPAFAVLGEWQNDNAGEASGMTTSLATLSPTPAANMPTAGTASYSGGAIGQLVSGASTYELVGTSGFTADFGARTVNGTMALNATRDGGQTMGFWSNVTVSAAIASGSNQFAGTASAPATTGFVVAPAMAGSVSGNFFGPQASALGGVWSIAGAGGASAVGDFGASQAAPAAAAMTATVAGKGVTPATTGAGTGLPGTVAGGFFGPQPNETAAQFTITTGTPVGLGAFGAHR